MLPTAGVMPGGRWNGDLRPGLDRNDANFVPLSPVSFVERSAEVFGDLPAVVHGARRYTWAQTRDRSARLAAALQALGVARGGTVTAMLHNTPEMVEAHYAVPAISAVLNALKRGSTHPLLAWQMNHCEAQVVITEREFAPTMREALRLLKAEHGRAPVVIDVCDSEYAGPGGASAPTSTRPCSRRARPLARLNGPQDEGTRSRSATPRARPATRRASSPTTAAPT